MSSLGVAERTHRAQFYDDETFLAERVSACLGKSLRSNGAAIAIARPLHLELIEEQLRAAGLDVEALRAAGSLVLRDATTTLAAFIRDGAPDERLFDEHVASPVRSLVARGIPVQAYGEMVDVLWERGQRDAVVQLETLWGKLLATTPFSLLCGYRLSRFDTDSQAFDHVCQLHDHVATQHVTSTASSTDVARAVVQLEQRARALEVEVERRTKLETRMLDLLALTGRMSAAHTREEVGQLAIESGMKAVEAIGAALWLVTPDGNSLELAAGESSGTTTRIPLDEDAPIAVAVREDRPIFLGSLDQYQREFPVAFERGQAFRPPGQIAYAILPVAGETKRLGAIYFAYDRERAFSGPERTFKEIVARHCGLTLERVELLEKEQRARAESELLYALTSEVAVAEDLESVYSTALTTVKFGTRSDRAAILLFDPDGNGGSIMRFKAWRNLSDTYRAAVEGHSPWTADTTHPTPIAVDDTETDEAWVAYRDVFRAEGIRALAFIPLVYRRKLIGKFMLYRDAPVAFTPRELQLAMTVAFHVGEALARKNDEAALARAYAEEKVAHATAEEATRAREEIISVVSHDLRNPLGAILLGSSSLLQVDGDRRVAGIAGRIHRQAERMARLIEDLVDFAGIQAGKLAIARIEHQPTEIIHLATDLFTPLAEERGLTLETTVQPGLPAISCDSERALQVMSNLVSNALKVTPKGGHVKIGVEARNSDVVFFVNDSGPGIDSAELPNLFERFWRGKSSQYRGAGLGLSIARGIVDAHGGKIWAESTLGVGSTFYFSLSSSN